MNADATGGKAVILSNSYVRLALVVLAILLPPCAWGGEAVPTEQDPVHEKRAVELGEQLRCLVCQNQTIAESNAELAVDLRRQIREQLRAGKSDSEIVDFMVQRYGDFVLYRPPLKATTLLLWGGPPLLLLIGAVVLVRNLRERRKRVAERELTNDEHERAAALLAGGSKEGDLTSFPVISFVVVAVVLTALALAWVLPPLLRRRPSAKLERAESNVALLREQLAELDADLASGTLSAGKYAQARSELERRVLEESESDPSPGEESGVRGRRAAVTLAVVIPVAAALLYLQIGSPDALSPQEAVPGHPDLTMEQIEGMVARLESRLREKPDDAAGWALLARSNLVLQRFPEAVKAYARATALVKDNASLYADYADAMAMSQGRRLLGEPERLIEQALKIDPDHVKALALAGTVAFEKKDFNRAIAHWERILKVAPPDSEIVASVRDSIAEARALAGGKGNLPVAREPASAPAAASVSGTVRLAPALAGKAAPTDIVFIFARAVSGPRMPLAVLRKQVRDLPVEFRLDDTMAMAPTAKLSNQEKVVIGARISKGGGPVGQPGDLEGFSAPVAVGGRDIAVVIDSEVR